MTTTRHDYVLTVRITTDWPVDRETFMKVVGDRLWSSMFYSKWDPVRHDSMDHRAVVQQVEEVK